MIYTPSIYGPLLFGFLFFFGWQWHHSQTARKRTTKWRRRGEKPLEMGDFDGDGDGCCTVLISHTSVIIIFTRFRRCQQRRDGAGNIRKINNKIPE